MIRRKIMMPPQPLLLLGVLSVGALLCGAADGGVLLEEPVGRSTAVRARVEIDGKIQVNVGGGQKAEHPLKAEADFGFLDRRLKSVGLGASEYKSVREYVNATVKTDVADRVTKTTLPSDVRRVVVVGRDGGPVRFSPSSLMMRETVDMLDMPGDPVSLAALLPGREVEVGEEWTPDDWAGQMLCSIEALAKSEVTCTLKSADADRAVITVEGRVEGARLGAYSKINLAGEITFDVATSMIATASFNFAESSEIGTITPGVMSTTSVRLARQPADREVSDEGLPVSIPPEALQLYFDAGPWGVRFTHGRDWHVYFAELVNKPQVIILRLLDNGRLVCQCNLASIPAVSPGKTTPLAEFESDIRRTLGPQFGEIVDRSQFTGTGDTKIFRTVVAGKFQPKDEAEGDARDMEWVYYLVAAPDGRQCSAIFAREPADAEKIGDQDAELVKSLQFFPTRVGQKP